MDRKEVYKALHRLPFQPVRVWLKDGRALDILRPHMAVVGYDFLDIGIQASGYPEGVCEEIVHVPLVELAKIEDLIVRQRAS